MILRNNILWCDDTGNKMIGCTRVSPGCKACYAANDTPARVLRHRGIETWGPKGQRVQVQGFSTKVRRLNKFAICDACRVLSLNGFYCNHCGGALRRIRFFANSNSDWLDDRWPIETLSDFLKDIDDCPNIDFQLLTKRPENCTDRLHQAMRVIHDGTYDWISGWLDGNAPQNVWLGVSVEDQQRADERIPQLLKIPARVRFLSCEPLLGDLNLEEWIVSEGFEHSDNCDNDICALSGGIDDCDGVVVSYPAVDWVIAGGESGPTARPMHPDWARSLRDQCQDARVPFFLKQWGEWKPISQMADGESDLIPSTVPSTVLQLYGSQSFEFPRGAMTCFKVRKKHAGRLLDGREWNEFPELQRREVCAA